MPQKRRSTERETPSLQDKLDHLYTLRKSGISPGYAGLSLRPEYLMLLERLGNPHTQLPPVIHVAGTNGKGSTIAFMRAILESAGYKVHAYTSPHLIKFNERIVLAGAEIDDVTLESLLDEILAINNGMEQTFFEITTALAFTAFARTPADIVLLETGLGGRLDSTNVIDAPLATVITTLSYDHTEFLGHSIEEIASEKAGIMKAGTPCVIAHQNDARALATLRARAIALGSTLYCADNGWSMTSNMTGNHAGDGNVFSIHTEYRSLNALPTPSLVGAHQIRNAATAIATLAIQNRFEIPDAAFAAGLTNVYWPARLQKIKSPTDWEIWLDGGHNDSAGAVLADQIKTWSEQSDKPLYIITGMMANKDVAAFAHPIAPLADAVVTIPIPGNQGLSFSPTALAETWAGSGAKTVYTDETAWPAPLNSVLANNPPGRVLITGSLYLAQEIGRFWQK